MNITTFADLHATTATTQRHTWDEFIATCANPPIYQNKQSCQLIKLGSFGNFQTASGSLRHDANVTSISGIEADYDAGQVSPEIAQMLLASAGIKCIIVTTPSHTPEVPRWRVFAPLSNDCSLDARREFVGRFNGALGGILAPESFVLSQSYYFGRVAGVEYKCLSVEGACVDTLPDLPTLFPVKKSPQLTDTGDLQIPSGQRNSTLLSIAGSMRKNGLGESAIYAALTVANNESCVPPLDDSEVATISRSVARYERDAMPFEVLGKDNLPPGARPIPVANGYALLSDADLAKLPPIKWSVKGVLPQTGVAAIYGASGSGKSFAVLDLAQKIATGSPWFGYRTTPCSVLYLCLEGSGGLAGRVAAYRLRHGSTSQNISYLTQPFSLLESGDIDALIDAIKAAGGAEVVVIDTLNRASSGADENDSRAMGLIIAASTRLQAAIGGLVILLHHTGKDPTKGLRGHSSLHGALDAAIEVRREGNRRLWCNTKSKDSADGQTHDFKLQVVQLGIDEDSDSITSCVIEPTSESAFEVQDTFKRQSQRAPILTLIHEFYRRGEWVSVSVQSSTTNAHALLHRELNYPSGMDKPECLAVLRDCQRDGLITPEDYKKADRHDGQRWKLTPAGLQFIGVANV